MKVSVPIEAVLIGERVFELGIVEEKFLEGDTYYLVIKNRHLKVVKGTSVWVLR